LKVLSITKDWDMLDTSGMEVTPIKQEKSDHQIFMKIKFRAFMQRQS